MADLDIPGLGHARQALTALAKKPKASKGLNVLKKQIILELYPEIRNARLAGHTWADIQKAIRESGIKPRFSQKSVRLFFQEIDRKFENETGVKALPIEPHYGGPKPKKKKSPGVSGARDPERIAS